VTVSTAARALVLVAAVMVAALSALTANGSGWITRFKTHSVWTAAVVLVVFLVAVVVVVVVYNILVLVALVVLAAAGLAGAAAGRDGDGLPKNPP